MNSLQPKFIDDSKLFAGHSTTLRVIGEFKGRQDILLGIETEALETLRKLAIIESTESSNRLEGIVTTHERIKDIVLNQVQTGIGGNDPRSNGKSYTCLPGRHQLGKRTPVCDPPNDS